MTTELRRIHNPYAEKCDVLAWTLTAMERRHRVELDRKDIIIQKQATKLEALNCLLEWHKLNNNDPTKHTKVMMIYGIDFDVFNAKDLFNLASIYGNVVRIKILTKTQRTAMVEMDDQVAVQCCIQHLHNCLFVNDTQIHVKLSIKNQIVGDSNFTMLLRDETPCFNDYTSCISNRFIEAEQAVNKNIILSPNKPFFNAPPTFSQSDLMELFNGQDIKLTAIRLSQHQTAGSSSGSIEFENTADAIVAIMKCNNIHINNNAKSVMKVYI